MLNARESFLASGAAAEFKKMSETTHFQVALDYALLAYAEELPAEFDPNGGWSAHAKLVGAREVLELLSKMHVKIEPPHSRPFTTLKPPQ
jgi:hypothetical protein